MKKYEIKEIWLCIDNIRIRTIVKQKALEDGKYDPDNYSCTIGNTKISIEVI